MPDPQVWGPDVGLRTLTLVGLCDTVTFQSVGAHLVGMGLLISCNHPYYHLDVASSLSSEVGYLFESFQSIWLKAVQHLVVFVFMREGELWCFYSTILIPPHP